MEEADLEIDFQRERCEGDFDAVSTHAIADRGRVFDVFQERGECSCHGTRAATKHLEARTGGRSFILKVLCVCDWRFIVFYHSIQLQRFNIWNIVTKQMI